MTLMLPAAIAATALFLAAQASLAMPFAPCPDGQQMLVVERARACAELAVTEAAREQGLMGRSWLAADTGMLFVFPAADLHRMWMKNTLVPLSVAFIDEQGEIINIEDMQPQTLDAHGARRPARYALEMAQGWFGHRKLAVGMHIQGLPAPNSAR